MKKIISILTLMVIMFTVCTVNVFAATTGEEVIFSVSLDTTNGTKTLGFKITFDPNDFELGTSTAADNAAEEYAEYIGTEAYPTLDAVTKELLGRASYVDDGYADTYAGYAGNKNLGTAEIGFEEKDGKGLIGFGYAVGTAKGALNKIDNMSVGGAVLKVKTTEKKEATILITEATYSGSDGVDTPCTANEVKIALNGYTGEEEEVFDDSFEGFVNDNGDVVETGFEKGNVATVFAKATENLAAESYGVWFGGCKYVGKLPVDNGEYWVIKLYDPDGILNTTEGYYDCEIFTPTIREAKSYTINAVN